MQIDKSGKAGRNPAFVLDVAVDPVDFAPALLRVQGKPPPPFAGLLLKALLVFFVCLLLWAGLSRLDIVAVATGKLVPQTYLRIVQPSEQGIVKEILVREGQAVREGQVLMRMDPHLTEADRRIIENELKIKRLQIRRIDAELVGKAIARAPDDDAVLFSQVEAQYKARRQAYQDALEAEKATIAKSRQDLKPAIEVEEKLKQTLPIYRDAAEGWSKLAEEGFAGKLLAQERVRLYIEREQDLRSQTESIVSLRATIGQAEKRMAQVTSGYQQQLHDERVDTAAQVHRLEQELDKFRHRSSLMELRAPQDGIVKDLATYTIGAVAAPGTILMTLVPNSDPLVAEVWVSNDDVGFVRQGQPVKVKLATYSFQKYGMLEGLVRHVGADASENQNQQQPLSTDNRRNTMAAPLTYKAIVEMKAQELIAHGINYALAPGMQVTAEIHLGTRTVLEYLFSPIRKAFHEAARER